MECMMKEEMPEDINEQAAAKDWIIKNWMTSKY